MAEADCLTNRSLRSLADEPVGEIVQCGKPAPNASIFNDLRIQPCARIELPQAKSLIPRRQPQWISPFAVVRIQCDTPPLGAVEPLRRFVL